MSPPQDRQDKRGMTPVSADKVGLTCISTGEVESNVLARTAERPCEVMTESIAPDMTAPKALPI